MFNDIGLSFQTQIYLIYYSITYSNCYLVFPEIEEYAKKIGIDPVEENHLIYLAEEGLLQELPEHWKPW